MMDSIWTATAELPAFSRLKRKLKTQVLVIGGGLAGLLCAHALTRSGVDCVLIEAAQICGGITKNTTAKITSQHGLIYQTLLRRFGVSGARLYLEANEAALARYRDLCRDINCEFEEKPSYVYSTDRPDRLERELDALEKIGFPGEYTDKLPLPFHTAGAIRFPHQAQFHPLKFTAAIAPGLKIYEHTAARAFDGSAVVTDGGRITAEHIVVATHFPLFNKHGLYPLKLYQHRSYVLALEGAGQVDGMYVDERKTGLSFRNAGGLLLLGGGSHRTGMNSGGWQELTAFAKCHYPDARITAQWATQDCMSLDGLPYIGLYSKRTPNLYVATGFNKWGMTSSMVAATVLRDLICGKENPYTDLLSPARTILLPQLALNGLGAAANLLTPTAPRCPHMGCALKWNPAERSWDCPCHGSRFTAQGKLIDNPATGDLKKPPPHK